MSSGTLEQTPDTQAQSLEEYTRLRIEKAWGYIQQDFDGSDYRTIGRGDINSVQLVDADDRSYIFKVPIKYGYADTMRPYVDHNYMYHERAVLELLEAAGNTAPVQVPKLLKSYDDALVLTFVPGAQLDTSQVRSFTPNEQQQLGHTTAECVAWLAEAIGLETYRKYTAEHCFSPPNRQTYIWPNSPGFKDLDRTNQFTLAAVSERLLREYQGRRQAGQLEPTIVGHDDLRAHNLTFTATPGNQRMHGAFDFGNAQPSSPEREFRHLTYIGPIATNAAIERYEALTDTPVSPSLVDFWGRVQVITTAASIIVNNLDVIPRTELRAQLELLLPDHDWREIDGSLSYD
jgi:hypothetical protein